MINGDNLASGEPAELEKRAPKYPSIQDRDANRDVPVKFTAPETIRAVACLVGVRMERANRETVMHKDEAAGTAKKARGSVKDAVGKATGDDKLRAEGKADKVEGKVQKGVGKAKDKLRDALKR